MIKNRLNVVADEGLSNIQSLCEGWANICCKPGRAIVAADIRKADILFTRSITAINESLIANSSIKFVGSATIGVDHVDLPLLSNMNIGFANAPGCNANAVVDYVMSALLSSLSDAAIKSSKVAVVGYGNVGKRLVACLRHFKIKCIVYDPYEEVPTELRTHSFNDILTADVISLHVPLTRQNTHPTFHLLGAEELAQIKRGALLINTSRGAVIDNEALFNTLSKQPSLSVALDVWEGEPNINMALLERVKYATGHIAGYSIEGKMRGSCEIVTAAKTYLNVEESTNNIDKLRMDVNKNDLQGGVLTLKTLEQFRTELLKVCDLQLETNAFLQKIERGLLQQSVETIFDSYRKGYPLRHELDYRGLL